MKNKLYVILLRNLLLILFSSCQFSSSYIINMSELRDPKTGQRILLYGDIHAMYIDTDKDQKSKILEQIDKVVNDKDYSIMTENIPKSIFKVIKLNSDLKKYIKKLPIFVDLLLNFDSKYFNVVNADMLRYSTDTFNKYMAANSYHEFNINNNMVSYIKDLKLIQEKLQSKLSEIAFCNNELGGNLKLFYEKHVKLDISNPNLEIHERSKFLMENVCDLEMLLSIAELNKKNIILFAGLKHKQNIEEVLLSSGYVKVFYESAKFNNNEINNVKDVLAFLKNDYPKLNSQGSIKIKSNFIPLSDKVFNLI